MLRISHWKAAAILFTVLVVSAMAIPNFLSEKTFQALPKWAQHRVVPGIEYQGGTRQLLEVNADFVRKQMTERLRDDVRKILREGKIGLVQAPVVRGLSVEVRIRESDLQRGFAALNEWLVLSLHGEVGVVRVAPVSIAPGTVSVTSLTAGGSAPPLPPSVVIEVVSGGIVRLAVTENAIHERVQQSRRAIIEFITRRVQEMGVAGASVQPRGSDRIEVVIPGIDGRSWMYVLGSNQTAPAIAYVS